MLLRKQADDLSDSNRSAGKFQLGMETVKLNSAMQCVLLWSSSKIKAIKGNTGCKNRSATRNLEAAKLERSPGLPSYLYRETSFLGCQ